MHPSLAAQLTHPGVDGREAGAPLAPGLKPPLGMAPADRSRGSAPGTPSARWRGSDRARGRRSRASTAGAGTRRLPRRACSRCSISRGETHPKCRYGDSRETLVGGQRVAPVAVALHRRRPGTGAAPRAPAPSPPGIGSLHLLLEPERRQRRELARARPSGCGAGSERGAPEHLAPGLAQPGAVERREHRVGIAGAGPDRLQVVDGEQPGMGDRLDAGVRAAPASTCPWRRRANGPTSRGEVHRCPRRARAPARAARAAAARGGRTGGCPAPAASASRSWQALEQELRPRTRRRGARAAARRRSRTPASRGRRRRAPLASAG